MKRYLLVHFQTVFAMCITGFVDLLLSERYSVDCTTEIFCIEFDNEDNDTQCFLSSH